MCIGQQENNPASFPRHVESDDGRGSCPHKLALRDPPHGENLNIEPVLQSAGVDDGEQSVNEEEANSTRHSSGTEEYFFSGDSCKCHSKGRT